VLPFLYALAQLHPLLKSVPSSSTSSPLELALLLEQVEVDTFLTAPLLDVWDVVLEDVIALGAETLLPPLVERGYKHGDGNGEDTGGMQLGDFKLRVRLLYPPSLPLLGSLAGSSGGTGRGEGGGVNLCSLDTITSSF